MRFKNWNSFFSTASIYLAFAFIHMDLRPTDACSSKTAQTTTERSSSSPVPKIFNGKDAEPNEFPFQVYFMDNKPRCGGIILNKSFVLTAAHCFDKYDKNQLSWTVVAGDHNWVTTNGDEQKRSIQERYIHPHYKPVPYLYNDIALVRLSSSLNFNEHVQPANLPDKTYVATGEAVVSGWGRLVYGDSARPQVLQKVNVPIVPNADCPQANAFLDGTVMCAGGGKKDACRGDSGGPLTVTLRNSTQIVVGLVSNGDPCGDYENGLPGIYTKVTKYLGWIRSLSFVETVNVDCGGLIKIPDLRKSLTSFQIKFTSTGSEGGGGRQGCLWTLDNIALDNAGVSRRFLTKAKITLVQSVFQDGEASLAVIEWHRNQELASHPLLNNQDPHTSSQLFDAIYLSFTSSQSTARKGTGFVVRVDIVEVQRAENGLNFSFRSSTGSESFGDYKSHDRVSIVVNPKATITLDEAKFIKSCASSNFVDVLRMYEVGYNGAVRQLGSFCSTTTVASSVDVKFPVIAVLNTFDWVFGSAKFKLSWK